MSDTPALQLDALRAALATLQQGGVRPADFSHQARAQTTLLAALPQRYTTVLHDLLDRLESSALFSDESCSFSQKDLVDSLQMWVDKAQTAL